MRDIERSKEDLINELVQLRVRSLRPEQHLHTGIFDIPTVLESTNDGCCVIDRSWRLLYINHLAASYTGQKPEELIGANLLELYPDLLETEFGVNLRMAMATGIKQTIAVKSNNGDRWDEFRIYPVAEGIIIYFQDITARKQAEEKVQRQNAILDGINRIFHEALTCNSEEELGKTCLGVAQELTCSELGFINEINAAGDLGYTAISDLGWKACQMPKNNGQPPKSFKIHGIYGRVVLDGISFFTNHPDSHPDRIGLPEGHPPVAAFLGTPLIQSGRVIGLIGLGNKEGGYSEVDVEMLEALSPAIVQVLMRKRAEQALADNHQRLEALVDKRTRALHEANQGLTRTLESISDVFFTLDTQWRVTYWNSAAEAMFNLSRKEILGRIFWEVFPKSVGSDSYNEYHRAMRKSISVSFITLGEYTGRWVEARAYPAASGLTIYLKDITERKLTEDALHLSQENFRKIFLESPDATAIIRMKDNCYINVNNRFLNSTGYSRDEVIGRTPGSLNLWLEGYEISNSIMKQLMETGRVENMEFTVKNKRGHRAYALVSSVAITYNDEPCRLTTIKDISKEKRMEHEIARLDRLNLVGEMAASIGHEIRNPMTAVRGFLQMLGAKSEYSEDQPYFEIMIEELDRANLIISEYLGMAKDKKINLKPGLLDDIINSLYPMIQSSANKRDMNVMLMLNNPPPALVDENEIRQLVLNLVHNGFEAMAAGSTLTIGTFESKESVLYVKDEGPGISPELIDKLGTPFQTTKETGTGLGLPVCYSIAARHNARIVFDTGPAGTTFYVRFPAAAEQVLPF